MQGNNSHVNTDGAKQEKPYAMVGSGRLASSIWKTGDESSGWEYRFNVFRLAPGGRVGQRFRPNDLKDIVKLVKVLAAVLLDDGCISGKERLRLSQLVAELDQRIGAGA